MGISSGDEAEFPMFLSTQAQANMDMWEDQDRREKQASSMAANLQQFSLNTNDDLDFPSTLAEDNITIIKRADKTYKRQKNNSENTGQRSTKQVGKKKKGSSEESSITGRMAMRHSSKSSIELSKQSSILKILSGKKRKVNDILDKIELLESKTSQSSSEVESVYENKMVYTKDEWFNLMKIIRVNFPNLSKKSKLTLSKINKTYEEQYDSQYQDNSQDNLQTGSLWNMASTVPQTRLTDEDLKWLYDLDDINEKKGLANSNPSSFSETSEFQVNDVLTLSQIIDQPKEEEVVDLTQKSDKYDKLSFNPSIFINNKSSDIMEAPSQPQQKRVQQISQMTPQINRVIEVPSSTPTASPIKISPSKLSVLKRKLVLKDPKIDVKASVMENIQASSIGKHSTIVESFVSTDPSRKSNHNSEFSSPMREFINKDLIEEVNSVDSEVQEASYVDNEKESDIQIVDGKFEIDGVSEDIIDEHQFGNYYSKKIIDLFESSGGQQVEEEKDEEDNEEEKEEEEDDDDDIKITQVNTESVNQLANIHIDSLGPQNLRDISTQSQNYGFNRASLGTPIPESIEIKSSNSSIYSTARSHLPQTQKQYRTTRYEFKGVLNDVFQIPFGKIEAKVTHQKRKKTPDVIPDSESEDDDEISIIEITKEVPKIKTPANLLQTNEIMSSFGDVSELQVPSSQNDFDVPSGLASQEASISTDIFPPSNVEFLEIFKNMTSVSQKILLEKWGFQGNRTKQAMIETLSTIYQLLTDSDPSYLIEVDMTPKDKETKHKNINEFFEALLEFPSEIVQASVFNHISDIVTKNEELYEKILVYEPISLDSVTEILSTNGIILDQDCARSWAFSTGVSYSLTLLSNGEREIKAKSGSKKRKTKNVEAKPKAKTTSKGKSS
ncbi:hypothetical protein DASC09_043800 [Saccharomycopsis crataegensis]|uniref:Structure-specific endonuclease subunit SLX4 n=1 Tax=Saccharomycopsis crataegensis TaxID=43959 RepID=A0AAV5QRX9_9ASCO|nr:hypothetical protein DASC09_043800 [Saccharomycopsis crataegensis]